MLSPHKMANHVHRPATGLPQQFVVSMRTLFDIMDDRKCGLVRFSDIESRWKEDEHKRLPRGVIDCLKRVTPPDGMLSFERFCAGLNICLLRNRCSDTCPTETNMVNRKPPLPSSSATHGPDHGGGTSCVHRLKPCLRVDPKVNHSPNSPSRGANSDSFGNGASITNGASKKLASDQVNPSGQASLGTSAARPSKNNLRFQDSEAVGGELVAESVPASPSRLVPGRKLGPDDAEAVPSRPHLVFQRRALSMPLLGDASGNPATVSGDACRWRVPVPIPPIPDVYGQVNNSGDCDGRPELRGYKSELMMANVRGHRDCPVPSNVGDAAANGARNRRGIMTVLQNWHQGMLNDAAAEQKSRAKVDSVGHLDPVVNSQSSPGHPSNFRPAAARTSRNEFQFGDPLNDRDRGGGTASDGDINAIQVKETTGHFRKGMQRRREPRRHTLANGIDYNMLKRMKQLEQEKDVLLQGREAVEKARSWYLKQILGVQEKMKYIGQNNGHLEYSTEAHQERLNFQMTQIYEANQHLSNLVESSERGFPIHMNLAVRRPSIHHAVNGKRATPSQPSTTTATGDAAAVIRLKELNRLLTEEVSRKNERITQLEMEKVALVRELFQARSQGRRESDDTTLM